MLSSLRRADHDEAAVLRLDPLMLAAAQADELGLMPRLRREFGPEAHLAVTQAERSLFVMAARAGQENEVAVAIRRRMAAVAPARLTGTRPGILAMFIEDTDRTEWRLLRERMDLEGEARQFLTDPGARSVVAVTCTSRLEMFGMPRRTRRPMASCGSATSRTRRPRRRRWRRPSRPRCSFAGLCPAPGSGQSSPSPLMRGVQRTTVLWWGPGQSPGASLSGRRLDPQSAQHPDHPPERRKHVAARAPPCR